MGERVGVVRVKVFEMPPLCDEMPPFHAEEAALCGEKAAFQ